MSKNLIVGALALSLCGCSTNKPPNSTSALLNSAAYNSERQVFDSVPESMIAPCSALYVLPDGNIESVKESYAETQAQYIQVCERQSDLQDWVLRHGTAGVENANP